MQIVLLRWRTEAIIVIIFLIKKIAKWEHG